MNITYEKNGDYLVPNLVANKETEGTLTKFGQMRKNYLKDHRSGIYTGMLLKGTLNEHLLQIQEQAEQRMKLLTAQMSKEEGATEELKATDQMIWVTKMNSIRNIAEEVVLKELIYN
ncbi:MAG: TnpV protein [Mobilitalea sp.]